MAVGGRERKEPKAPPSRQLVPVAPAALTQPIVVPNTFWTPTNPLAYDGGRPSEITHLREYGETDAGRQDDGRWGGLDVVPTKADYILDLIRANSLWPLLSGLACCAFEMMSGATSKNDMDRWGMFPFRASPRQSDVLIVAGTLTTKMAGPLIRLWEQMPDRVADTSAATPLSRASTGSCRWTSTFPAARRGLRGSFTACSSSARS
jgi:hypothetical protein